MRLRFSFVAVALVFGVASANAQSLGDTVALSTKIKEAKERARSYQGRNAEQTERFSKKVRVGRDGRVNISNISGDITVTGGSGDEVSVEAVKRTRGDRDELSRIEIIVEDRAGHVDVRTNHLGRTDHVSVDYTVTMPASASVEVASVSGSVKISSVKGSVRATSVSGTVTATDTPKLESAKSTSGNVSVSGLSTDGDVSAGSISGNVVLKGVKARGLELGSVSGDVLISDATCDRVTAKSVSGGIEYSGAISKGGVYRDHVAFRYRPAHADKSRRVLPQREQLQRFDPLGPADHDRRRRGPLERLAARRRGESARDPRRVWRWQRHAHSPHLQRQHRHREAIAIALLSACTFSIHGPQSVCCCAPLRRGITPRSRHLMRGI